MWRETYNISYGTVVPVFDNEISERKNLEQFSNRTKKILVVPS